MTLRDDPSFYVLFKAMGPCRTIIDLCLYFVHDANNETSWERARRITRK